MRSMRVPASVREAVKSRPLLLSSWRLVSRAARDRYVQGAVLFACGISAGAFFSGTDVSTWVLILVLPMLLSSFLAARRVRKSLTLRLRVSQRRGGSVLWLEESGWVGDTRFVKKPAKVARALVDRGFVLDAVQLLESRKVWLELSNSYLQKIWRTARDNGQMITSLRAISLVAERTNSASDVRLRELLQAEINVMNVESIGNIDADFEDLHGIDDSVLHVVGKTILDYQNGYTIRTHELCRAQVNLGFDVSVVGQMGFVETHGLDKWSQNKDGVEYLAFAGSLRNEIPLDQWVRQSVENLVTVVRNKRPAVIHAHSDFLNALIASEVAERFNVPIVYEVRGFWEETLLTNLSQRNKWPSVEDHVNRHGLPEAYTLRRQIEQRVRDRADAIVTLDEAMADQIRRSGAEEQKIVISPNSLRLPDQSENGLQREEMKSLRVKLGFPDDAIIVGIASSLVPYEGVEVLIDAVSVLQNKNPNTTLALLIVGDGVARQELEKRAKKADLRHTLFTGQIPHESVSQYVALLDIAVFPRISTPVTERVQPLKPIEALGMGCSVVVSSVAPLKRLADETQLIRVFNSGDAASLATELSELVSSPTTRAILAEKGKRWVRDNRTWSKNAKDYAELYKTLYRKDVTESSNLAGYSSHASPQNRKLDNDLLVPLEKFVFVTFLPHDTEVPPSHFDYSTFPPIELRNLDWASAALGDRSWGWVLHAWDFMDGTLRRFQEERDEKLLRWCWELAESWLDSFDDGNPRGTMAFYDMAIAQRSTRLAFLIDALLTFGNAPPAESDRMMSSLDLHAELLLDPKHFSGWNNHGLYIAFAGLSLVRRFPTARWAPDLREVSEQRAEGVVAQQFLPDGGHVEHSFNYHRMVLKSIIEADHDGILGELSDRFPLEAAKKALNWMIRPDGFLEQVGDSPQKSMLTSSQNSKPPWWSLPAEPGSGSLDEESSKVLILRETGFLFIRGRTRSTPEKKNSESYLTFSGSFHSRTHKHADDLSITWFDLGREILIDAGRYGYGKHLDKHDPLRITHGFYYDSPERQYVESTKAHNTVEADGLLHDRVNRKPYGAARFLHRENRGVHWATAKVDHGFWSHDRSITLKSGVSLAIKDKITSQDGERHDFRQWFNLPGDFEIKQVGEDCVVFADQDGVNVSLQSSEAILVFPLRGSRDTELRGFRSKEDYQLEPSWNLAFEKRGVRTVFRTKITLHFVGGKFD